MKFRTVGQLEHHLRTKNDKEIRRNREYGIDCTCMYCCPFHKDGNCTLKRCYACNKQRPMSQLWRVSFKCIAADAVLICHSLQCYDVAQKKMRLLR